MTQVISLNELVAYNMLPEACSLRSNMLTQFGKCVYCS